MTYFIPGTCPYLKCVLGGMNKCPDLLIPNVMISTLIQQSLITISGRKERHFLQTVESSSKRKVMIQETS